MPSQENIPHFPDSAQIPGACRKELRRMQVNTEITLADLNARMGALREGAGEKVLELKRLLKRGKQIRADIVVALETLKSSSRSGKVELSTDESTVSLDGATLTQGTETEAATPLRELTIVYVVGAGGHEEITTRNITALREAGAVVISRDGDKRKRLPASGYVVFHSGGSSHSSQEYYKGVAKSEGLPFILLPLKLGSSLIVSHVVERIRTLKEKK